MAGFKTHVTFSGLIGVGYGSAGVLLLDAPLSTSILAGGLCGVSGMLPDIDSDSGIPLREAVALTAAIVPMMLVDRLKALDLSAESVVLVAALFYLLVRFVFAEIVKRVTVHRGMFHSIPAAIIFGELAFLLTSGDDMHLRFYKAGGVLAGYLSHLALDEIYSIEWRYGLLRVKRSFGTAVKIWGDKWMANIATFALLGLLTFATLYEPTYLRDHYRQHIDQAADRAIDSTGKTVETAGQVIERWWR